MRVTGARLLGAVVGVVLFLATARAGEEKAAPAGAVILTEGSAWRTHVVWGKVLMQGASGLKDAKLWGTPAVPSALPPENWPQPEFDDSAWDLWRETHVLNTLKTKDGKDTGVRLYDHWQYGIQLSSFMTLRCLRGKFTVEDPAQVKGLTLSAAYRGGLVVYLNGQEVGRVNVPKPAQPDPLCPAEAYPDEIYYGPNGKVWWLVNSGQPIPTEPAALELFNKRIRAGTISIPTAALKKGVNVLGIAIHRAPYSEKAMSERESRNQASGWGSCGVASLELRGEGAVAPAVSRPKGVQVWNAGILTKASLLGSMTQGRWGQGAGTIMVNYPLSWVSPWDALVPIRMVGTRNGVFSGQVLVSSDAPIRGLKAGIGDLAQAKGGPGRIPAANCQVCYMGFPDEPPSVLTEPGISLLDVLYEKPPAEVPARAQKPQTAAAWLDRGQANSWADAGAMMAVWLKVRVPADAPPGDYEGTLTVSAEGLKPVAVPVKLAVHGLVLPDPKNFVTHVGLVHSPDTLALKYKVPLWSDQHFKLMEKTLDYMGQAGGKTVWLPLITDTWVGNREGFAYWVKQGDGGYKYDFKVFDRYLDLVQKHLNIESVNLYVYHPPYVYKGELKRKVSALGASGKVEPMETPVYAAGPEAEKFWKPAIAEARERLKKRNLPEPSLGLVIENGEGMQPAVECFKAAWPEGKWAHLAHYGGSQGHIFGAPYGYVMSVWGLAHAPWKSKKWGAPELPCVFIEHWRADRIFNLRPIAPRGCFYLASDGAMNGTRGIGPLGMDFWNLTAAEGGWKGGPQSLEGNVTNLTMTINTTAALLAPGPEGPLSTARYEIFREGLQVTEAHAIIEKALGDPAKRQQLGDALYRRCEEINKERGQAGSFINNGESYAEGEGWRWYENSGWEELAGKLFDCAAEVSKATGGK